MKRIISLLLCAIIIITVLPYANAAEPTEVVYFNEHVLENGLTVVDIVSVSSRSRASEKTAYREQSIYDGDTLVAYIRFVATFRYDGSTASVVSKTVTHSDTYDGWDYVQNSFASSGGTVTLSAKITKWFIFNTNFTMTLSCDKNGTISYS